MKQASIDKQYAIIRVEKVKRPADIRKREAHNLRTEKTPNADPERLAMDQELVNLAGRPAEELVAERIKEAIGSRKVRGDQVHCMEVIMTGSPAAFERDAQGNVPDQRGSQWLADELKFAKERWGKNLVGFMLHQDEKTPHIHAFVVPITEKGRLNANELFTPKTLSELQTDYGVAMKDYGMERGLAGSRASHKGMREMYALQGQTAAQLAPLIGPVATPEFQLAKPTRGERAMDIDGYLKREQDRLNALLAAVVQEGNSKLALAGDIAIAKAGEADQARGNRNWVAAEKKRKTELSGEVEELNKKVGDLRDILSLKELEIKILNQDAAQVKVAEAYQVEQQAMQRDQLALQVAQGPPPADLLKRGQELWEAERVKATTMLAKKLELPLASEAEYYERVRSSGYSWGQRAPDKPQELIENRTGARFTWVQVKPGGPEAPALATQIAQAVQATEQAKQEREQASIARQLAAMREDERKWHLNKEYDTLRAFSSERGQRDYAVARIRVPHVNVAGMVASLGRNTAVADEKPGKDGLTGINLCYNPRTTGASARISAVLAETVALGGEIFERDEAKAIRQKNTVSDHDLAANYVVEKNKEKGIEM
jgi:hypothetical protein